MSQPSNHQGDGQARHVYTRRDQGGTIKPHRHHDEVYVLDIVSKPGMIVHVPVGVAHDMKAEGWELTLVDFAQPLSIRIRWSGSSSRCPHDARRSYE
jgi:hypothetical protein